MSKIGNQPIIIPENVVLSRNENKFLVKGPQGEVSIEIPEGIEIQQEGQQLLVKRKVENKKTKALHGLTRKILANAIKGVLQLWEKVLEIHGTGYRASKEGETLVLKLGYSHTVRFPIPKGVNIEVKGNRIEVKGIDKQQVGEIAAKIREIKKPDKYKGKGIRYKGELLRLKPGKKVKTAA